MGIRWAVFWREKSEDSRPGSILWKKIRVYSVGGVVTIGEFYGYDYDFDDDGNEFLEFDVEDEYGKLTGFTKDEIERIDIIR